MVADRKKGKDEKRAQPRVDFFSKVKVIDKESNSAQEVFAGNVSRGGMFLRSNRPLPKGRQVALEFELDDGPVRVEDGEVVWNKPFEPVSVDGTVPGMGVRFKDVPAESRQRIESFIDEVLQENGQANGAGPLRLEARQEEPRSQPDEQLPADILAMERETTPVPTPVAEPEPAPPPAGAAADSGEWTMSGPPAADDPRESSAARLKLDLDSGKQGDAMAKFSTPPAPRQRAMLFTIFVLAVAAVTFLVMWVVQPFGKKPGKPASTTADAGRPASSATAPDEAPAQTKPRVAKADAQPKQPADAGPPAARPAPAPATTDAPAAAAPPAAAPKPAQPEAAPAQPAPGTSAQDTKSAAAASAALTVGPPVFISKPDGWRLLLKVNGPVTVKHFTLKNPPRLAIDVRGAAYAGRTRTFADPVEFVSRVRVGPHPDFVRFVLDFRGERVPEFKVSTRSQAVEVRFPGN